MYLFFLFFFVKLEIIIFVGDFFINRCVYVGGIGGIIISNLMVKIYN